MSPRMRPSWLRWAAVAILAGLSGCFLEATAGVSGVTGANDARWRVAPSFGVSAGVAYDALGVTRLSLGGGGQMVRTPVNGAENVIMAGPLLARIDLGRPVSKRASVRAAASAAFGGGWRFRGSPTGGNAEGRSVGSALGVFLGPALSIELGAPRLDLAVGPSGIFVWGTPGLTTAQAWGGELRVTLSLPLSYKDGLLVGASVRNALAFASSKAVVAEAERLRAEDRKASLARGQSEIDAMQRQNDLSRPAPPPEEGKCPPGTHLIGPGTCGR